MALKRLNENIYIDTDDIVKKEETNFSFPLPDFRGEKHNDIEITQTKTFARIIANKDFISCNRKIKKGTKGAYIEVKIIKNSFSTIVLPLVKIGENSWIEGSLKSTDCHNSFVEKWVVVYDNTLIESNATIKTMAKIGQNCRIGYASTIGEKCNIKDNCLLRPLTVIGARTTLGNNTKFTGHEESPKIGITPLYETKYCRERRIDSKTSGPDNKNYQTRLIEKLKDCYHSHLPTRIGDNVEIKSGVRIYSGATVGDGAKLPYGTIIRSKEKIKTKQEICLLP